MGYSQRINFSQQMFTNRLKMDLLIRDRVKKTVRELETHWRSTKKKGSVASGQKKKVHINSFLRHETIACHFLEKGAIANSAFYWELLTKNSPHLLNNLRSCCCGEFFLLSTLCFCLRLYECIFLPFRINTM